MTLLICVSVVAWLAVRANKAQQVALAEAARAMQAEKSAAAEVQRAQQSRQLAETEAQQATAAEEQIQKLQAELATERHR